MQLDIAFRLVFNVHAHFFLTSIASRCNARTINNSRRVKSYLIIADIYTVNFKHAECFQLNQRKPRIHMSYIRDVDSNEKFSLIEIC